MMAAATDATSSLVPIQPVFTDAERLALAGFLAGYRGLTREAYTLDLIMSPATMQIWEICAGAQLRYGCPGW